MSSLASGCALQSPYFSAASGAENAARPAVLYVLSIEAGGLVVRVNATIKPVTTSYNQSTDVDVSDTLGFPLPSEEFLFLCSFQSNITLRVEVDTDNQYHEVSEENNGAALHNVPFNDSSCPGIQLVALGPIFFTLLFLNHSLNYSHPPPSIFLHLVFVLKMSKYRYAIEIPALTRKQPIT